MRDGAPQSSPGGCARPPRRRATSRTSSIALVLDGERSHAPAFARLLPLARAALLQGLQKWRAIEM
eukprot:14733221-Alexandrium_andersonii.AAC.1